MAETLPLLKGTLDLLLLKALSWRPLHGFALAQWLEERAGGQMTIDDSALYHALHRLEERNLVKGSWAVTENGRRARYYKLTAAGSQHLERQTELWERYAAVVGGILSYQPAS